MKYQTRASCAEEHVMEMLKSEKNIIRPWSLADYKVTNRTLQTTAGEISLLFSNHMQVRPGFEIVDETVFIPNLFVKISGFDPILQEFYDAECLAKRDLCFFYPSLQSFNMVEDGPADIKDMLDENGAIDRNKLLNSGFFTYSFLRVEYQESLISKMNDIIKNRHTYFTGTAKTEEPALILSHLLQIDKGIMTAYNSFDFPFLPPAIIIHSNDCNALSPKQAHILMLLNLLGFDIVLVSMKSFSDIENVIKPEHYDLFYGDSIKTSAPQKQVKKTRVIIFSVIAALVLSGSYMAYTAVFSGKPSHDMQQEKVTDNENINIDKEDAGDEEKKADSGMAVAIINDTFENNPVMGEISIEGRILDYLDNPVFHTDVEIYQVRSIMDGIPSYGSDNYWEIPGWNRIRTSTDSNGKFVFDNFSDFKENKLHTYVLEFYIPWELQYAGQLLQNPDPVIIDLLKARENVIQIGDVVAKHGGGVIVEVLDEKGNPYVRDINIDLRRTGDQRGFPITTCGNEKGLHYSSGLPDGSYFVEIMADGYKSEKKSNITVKKGIMERIFVNLSVK